MELIVRIVSASQSAPNHGHGFDLQVITVKIGVNNTVRWIIDDYLPHGILTPNDDDIINLDPAFVQAVERANVEKHGFLLPGDTLGYSFTKPSRIDCHICQFIPGWKIVWSYFTCLSLREYTRR